MRLPPRRIPRPWRRLPGRLPLRGPRRRTGRLPGRWPGSRPSASACPGWAGREGPGVHARWRGTSGGMPGVTANRRPPPPASPAATSTAACGPPSSSPETSTGPRTVAAMKLTADRAYAAARSCGSVMRAGQRARRQLGVAGIAAQPTTARQAVTAGGPPCSVPAPAENHDAKPESPLCMAGLRLPSRRHLAAAGHPISLNSPASPGTNLPGTYAQLSKSRRSSARRSASRSRSSRGIASRRDALAGWSGSGPCRR